MTEDNLLETLSSILPKDQISTQSLTEAERKRIASYSSNSGLFLVICFITILFLPLIISFIISLSRQQLDVKALEGVVIAGFFLAYFAYLKATDNSYNLSALFKQDAGVDLRDDQCLTFCVPSEKYIQFLIPERRGASSRFLIQLPKEHLLLLNANSKTFPANFSSLIGVAKTVTWRWDNIGDSVTLSVAPNSGIVLDMKTPEKKDKLADHLWIKQPGQPENYKAIRTLFSFLPDVSVFPGTLETWSEDVERESERMKKLIVQRKQ